VKISVVIPTVRGNTIETAVASIRRQTHTDFALIVVAQGDDPPLLDALERIRGSDDRFTVECLQKKGVSAARNHGISLASAEIVAIMDDDCEADEHWLTTLASIFGAEPEVQLVGGTLIAPPPTQRFGNCPSISPDDVSYKPSEHGFRAPPGMEMLTANMAFRKTVWENIGGFDELLGPGTAFAAGEDPDFVFRIEAADLTMRTSTKAIVTHSGGYRYGLKAQQAMLKGYARGQGALAAKLMFGGDRRGIEQFKNIVRPISSPKNVFRAYYFLSAYLTCKRAYELQPNRQLLQKKTR
jgi:glycosyltransferase involved in cell wall biosynthesis